MLYWYRTHLHICIEILNKLIFYSKGKWWVSWLKLQGSLHCINLHNLSLVNIFVGWGKVTNRSHILHIECYKECFISDINTKILESIQATRKRPTYRCEDTIVWERWYFWRSEINIDYRLLQFIRGFCSSPMPIFKLSLQVAWIDSSCSFEAKKWMDWLIEWLVYMMIDW